MENYSRYFEANKNLWNQRTAVHKDSEFYNLAAFKTGENVLTPIELNEVGDVKGKSLLHLQCHFGMDSLNWARLGADVTGVDLSDVAIKEAKLLNDELKMNANFICCNIYDLLTENQRHAKAPLLEGFGEAAFDIVYTSYGTIGWLPDLKPWATIIAERLKPGGFFYMADFHPVLWMFDDDFTHIRYAYENREVIITENYGTYTDRNAEIKGKEYSWNHSISELMNALIAAGLNVEFFNEYMYSPYPCFSNMVETQKGQWQIKGLEGKIPMVYSLKASVLEGTNPRPIG
jgi:SAM-dependent methyltransferase